jgi:hypothetical protein
MERALDITSRKWTEAWVDPGYGPSVWLLPGGGEFYTKSCTRCARLIPHAWRYDLKEDRERNSEIVRCVHCAEPIDSMMLSNRKTSQATFRAPMRKKLYSEVVASTKRNLHSRPARTSKAGTMS